MNWGVVARLAAARLLGKNSTQQGRRFGLFALIAAGLGMVGMLLVLVMVSAVAATGTRIPTLAGAGAAGIPPVVFSAYLNAEANAHTIRDTCAVDWPVVAGIWHRESGHATHGGASVDPAGNVTPPIYGIRLNGSRPGTAITTDSDNGILDRDTQYDRAVGPAQFLPRSWMSYGRDGNGDGAVDPQNVYDAALSTVAYLCIRTPGDYTDPTQLARALRGYNNSQAYVDAVSAHIAYYRAFTITTGPVTADGLYAFPLPAASVTLRQIRGTHHDYPASDLGVPEGTPVYNVHPGTVANLYTPCPDCRCGYGITITGLDNHRYTYCHAQGLAAHLKVGASVGLGELIMLSGNTGNSTGPHLHFQIRNPAGILICPQLLLEAWWTGVGLHPTNAPTSGCTH